MANNAEAVIWFSQHGYHLFRYGMAGIESLDYGQIHNALSIENNEDIDQADLFWRLREIATGVINESRKKQS